MTRLENGRLDGPIFLNDTLILNGIATGSITVEEGGALLLHGTASGGVDVRPGGTATIAGVLRGTLRCAGAVELLGVLDGSIVIEPGGSVVAAEGAHRRTREGKTLAMGATGEWEPATSSSTIDERTKRWPVSAD